MYAIILTGGKQYKVAKGDVIEVEKLEQEVGAEASCRRDRRAPVRPKAC